ncbi:MAG: ribonuclease HI [Bacteroidia bacterium]|nr:ribonuclease HI [Bacteroidia bacterium]MCF8425091.1 ribonuclease HI [Bacteroidia bacterium]MCF8446624.1 ribonuclease HI [Bacteroidia bacterium]
MKVTVYTDGSARGNPGRGGYGAVLVSGQHRKELSAGYRLTTNNRMELLAVIVAIESMKLENLDITIYTDSKYVCEAVEKKWVFGWAQKGFKDKKNPDLWRRFLTLFPKHNISFKWIKGHAGHPMNERCDVLATTAADGGNLLIDEFYEQEQVKSNLL